MSPSRIVAAITCLLIVGLSLSATAEESPIEELDDDEAQQRAAEFYGEAGQAYADGHFERAAELLDRAYRYDDNPLYRYNEILALEGAGEYETALELLDAHKEELEDLEGTDDIDELRTDLEEAAEDRRKRAEKPDAVEIPDEPRDEESVDDGPHIAGWTLVGTGTAALAGGLVVGSGILIDDTIDRLEGSTTPEDARQIYDDTPHDRDDDEATLRTHQFLAAGLLTGGVVAAATGASLLWLDAGSESAADPGASMSLQPYVTTDGSGLLLHRRF